MQSLGKAGAEVGALSARANLTKRIKAEPIKGDGYCKDNGGRAVRSTWPKVCLILEPTQRLRFSPSHPNWSPEPRNRGVLAFPRLAQAHLTLRELNCLGFRAWPFTSRQVIYPTPSTTTNRFPSRYLSRLSSTRPEMICLSISVLDLPFPTHFWPIDLSLDCHP